MYVYNSPNAPFQTQQVFADDKLKIAQMLICVFCYWAEIVVEKKKEKMLLTSISSFSHYDFKTFLLGRENSGLCDKGLIFSKNKLLVLRVCSTSPSKTRWEKEKLLVTSNFSFFHNVFYSFFRTFSLVISFEIVVCKLFQFVRVTNFVVWERANATK